MWSHYAKEHAGFCIQFERAQDFPTLSHALPVKYSSKYPEVNWVTDFAESLGVVMLRKHEGWLYECEDRIVMPGYAHKFLAFKPEAVVGIIFGCRISSESKNILIQLLDERRALNLPEIRLYTVKKHNSKYQLSIYSDE